MSPQEVREHIAYKRDAERTLRPEFAEHMLAALDAGAHGDYQALLRAAQWPGLPAVAFHTAPTAARAAIAAGGLRAGRPEFPGQPAGVYVAEQPDTIGLWAKSATWDVWQVSTGGLPYAPDPLNPRCWVLGGDVGPERLTLHAVEVD